MHGLMMDQPLLISSLIKHAAQVHGDQVIISKLPNGDRHEYDYTAAQQRALCLAQALTKLGISPGTRIATLAWNDYRHFEIYFAVSGMGAICHTINPRLFPAQIAYIANHAQDHLLFFDPTFLPLVETLAAQAPGIAVFVAMCDQQALPTSKLKNLLCYEDLIQSSYATDYQWPVFDELCASSLCYTSGTTGHPKGVLYHHRSTILHALTAALPDTLHLGCRETILPVVPMFHVNAWGIPYGAALAGTKLVLPGPHLNGAALCQLINDEQVTVTAGVPTVWQSLLDYLKKQGKTIPSLQRIIIGGAPAPAAMITYFELELGVEVRHSWGMTETSPIGTVNVVKPKLSTPLKKAQVQLKQGRAIYGVELKISNEHNETLNNDGLSCGQLKIRGPWVASAYYQLDQQQLDQEQAFSDLGWFNTGDISTIDEEGYMQIVDRSKDLIKSGGEWISSIQLESIALSHVGVNEAAVIGISHPKWDERPLLVVVASSGYLIDKSALLGHFQNKVAKWCIPDDVLVIDCLPHTATGKISKKMLREQLSNYQFQTN